MSETSKSQEQRVPPPPKPTVRNPHAAALVLNGEAEMSPSGERCLGGQQQQGLRAEDTGWELSLSPVSPAS